jgi:hypothetical protein
VKQGDDDTTENAAGKRWLPFLYIIIACAAAHLWCLGSVFYMDDIPQIRDSELIINGDFTRALLSAWTTLGQVVTYKLFGLSPVAFHAVNWLLHTATACALFAFGREFLRGKWPAGVALFGALLFAVHPLGSEIPNYARTQDLAWVTLFSLLAAWAMLRFLRGGGWVHLALCALAIAGATFSKGPGLFHALLAVAAVGLTNLGPATPAFLKKRWPALAGAAVALLAILWATGAVETLLRGTRHWSEPRFIGHAYTLSRVFWEFAWRSVIPLALSSDHEVTETLIPPSTAFWNIPDKAAMVAMAAFLTLTAFSVFLAWRKPTRLFGTCLFLFVATILFRFLYLIPEFMPEYRIYPGLPWFCLGAAILLTAGWKYLFETVSPQVPAVLLIAGFGFLSAKRSFVWHDSIRLASDVLDRYPARARALWEMNSRDAERDNWQAIIDRQSAVWPEVERQFVTRNQALAPLREIPSGDFVFAMVGIFGNYARALCHTGTPAAGVQMMAGLGQHMTRMGMTPENKPGEFHQFYHDQALVLEMAGNYQAAIDILRTPEEIPETWQADIARITAKIKAAVTPDS